MADPVPQPLSAPGQVSPPPPPANPDADERLLEKAAYRDIDGVTKALNDGANVNSVSSTSGSTALHLVTAVGRPYDNGKLLPIADLLISRGANVNLQNRDGMTPLMWAILAGNIEMMKRLLDAGADITKKHSNGQTALDMAREQFSQGVRLLEERQAAANPITTIASAVASVVAPAPNPEEDRKLQIAVQRGDIDGVRAALAAGADVNTTGVNFFKNTPLHQAVTSHVDFRAKMYPIIDLLLEKGANVNAQRSDDRHTPFTMSFHEPKFFYALFQKRPDLTLKIKEERPGREETPLQYAQRIFTARREKRYVADVIAKAELGQWDGAIAIARQEADIPDPASPVAAAAQAVQAAVGAVVAPAAPSNPVQDRRLINEVRNLNIAEITASLDAGANVNHLDRDSGYTPLTLAIQDPHYNLTMLPIIRLLIARGAKVNMTNTHGDTPLHNAAAQNNIPAIDALLEAGADVRAPNRYGRTPREVARRQFAPEAETRLAAAEAANPASPVASVAQAVQAAVASAVAPATPAAPSAPVSNSEQDRALSAAVESEDDAAAQAAILAGANPNLLLDGDRETVLIHYAATENRPMVEFLLNHGADVNGRAGPAADEPGWTALNYTRYLDIGEYIEAQGGVTARMLDGEPAASQIYFASDYATPSPAPGVAGPRSGEQRLQGRDDLIIPPITLVEGYATGESDGDAMDVIDVKEVYVAKLGRNLTLDQFFRKYMGDGAVFKVGPKFYGIPRKDLLKEYLEGSAIAYECTKTFAMDDPGTRGTFEYSDIYAEPYYALRTPAGVLYVSFSIIKLVLGTTHAFFKLDDKPSKKLENIASRSSVIAGGPVSSQLHCQAGSDGNVYTIRFFKLPEIEEEEESDEDEEPNVVFVKKGEDKTEFPLDLSQTVLQLKEAVKEKLGIAVEAQKMVFQGKVLEDAQTLGEVKVKKGYTIQLQVSGGRRLTKKRSSRGGGRTVKQKRGTYKRHSRS